MDITHCEDKHHAARIKNKLEIPLNGEFSEWIKGFFHTIYDKSTQEHLIKL